MPSRAHLFTVLATHQSMSSDVTYEVRKGHDQVIYCTCPAWRMKQGRASCKHIDQWRASNYQRPTEVVRERGLQLHHILRGDVVEVNCRGDIFLLRVTETNTQDLGGKVTGVELLDDGELPVNVDSIRVVEFRDVTRRVVISRGTV